MQAKRPYTLTIAILVMTISVIGITACSTLSLPKGATGEQKQSAYCQDARTLIDEADAVLAVESPSSALAVYYKAAKSGAETAILNYCK